ncbi:MAG: DUF3592 domain-containing protein [Chlorobi bacterium]|nr:DUF3592 domain-containing protein [Chlorobiota bacterium]
MFAIWLGFVVFSAKKFIRGKMSTNWPKIIATVKSSCIETKNGGKGLAFYSPKIEYQYSLNFRNYSNNNFTYMGTSGFTKRYAEKYVKKYTVGSEIEVSYNPKSPEMSVIIPGVHWGQYASMLFLTLMFFSFGYIAEILNFIWPGCEPNCT